MYHIASAHTIIRPLIIMLSITFGVVVPTSARKPSSGHGHFDHIGAYNWRVEVDNISIGDFQTISGLKVLRPRYQGQRDIRLDPQRRGQPRTITLTQSAQSTQSQTSIPNRGTVKIKLYLHSDTPTLKRGLVCTLTAPQAKINTLNNRRVQINLNQVKDSCPLLYKKPQRRGR